MESLLRIADVQKRVGLSRAAIYKKVRLKQFPPSIPLGTQTKAWVESEIQAWIVDRIAAARAESK